MGFRFLATGMLPRPRLRQPRRVAHHQPGGAASGVLARRSGSCSRCRPRWAEYDNDLRAGAWHRPAAPEWRFGSPAAYTLTGRSALSQFAARAPVIEHTGAGTYSAAGSHRLWDKTLNASSRRQYSELALGGDACPTSTAAAVLVPMDTNRFRRPTATQPHRVSLGHDSRRDSWRRQLRLRNRAARVCADAGIHVASRRDSARARLWRRRSAGNWIERLHGQSVDGGTTTSRSPSQERPSFHGLLPSPTSRWTHFATGRPLQLRARPQLEHESTQPVGDFYQTWASRPSSTS
jgi:hypothetical protein